MLVVNEKISVPLRELRFTFARSGGPGGQNVNKVNTKATLRWAVAKTSSLPEDVRQRFMAKYRRRISTEGEFIISSERFRDQGRNVADCLEKLRAMLAESATAPKPRRATKPSRSSVRRRLNDKKKQAEKKRLRRRVDE